MIGAFQAGVTTLSGSHLSVNPMFYVPTWQNSYSSQGTLARGIDPAVGITFAYEVNASAQGQYGFMPIHVAPNNICLHATGVSFRLYVNNFTNIKEIGVTDLYQVIGKKLRVVIRVNHEATANYRINYAVNNIVKTAVSYTTSIVSYGANAGDGVYVGCNAVNPTGASWQLVGTMKDVCIFDSLLSDNDIALYLAGVV